MFSYKMCVFIVLTIIIIVVKSTARNLQVHNLITYFLSYLTFTKDV